MPLCLCPFDGGFNTIITYDLSKLIIQIRLYRPQTRVPGVGVIPCALNPGVAGVERTAQAPELVWFFWTGPIVNL